jgi:hypothetical protein
MGYTHYMERSKELPKSDWDKFVEEVHAILKDADCDFTHIKRIDDEWTDVDGYLANEDEIHLNGKGEDSHESFVIERVHTENETSFFSFCKTARKPYDKYVCAINLLAKLRFPNDVIATSDGYGRYGADEDFEIGVNLLKEKLGIELEIGLVEGTSDITVREIIEA